MPDSIDVRDILISAQSDVDEIVAEAVGEFYRAEKMLELALKAATMTPDRWALLPPERRQQILEVFNAAK